MPQEKQGVPLEAVLAKANEATNFLLAIYRERARAGVLTLPAPDLYLANIGAAIVYAKRAGLTRDEVLAAVSILFDHVAPVPFSGN